MNHTPHKPPHPVETEPGSPENDAAASNPTHLPVEPEFGQALPQAEPDEPGVPKPVI
jgi:hypothetical protein